MTKEELQKEQKKLSKMNGKEKISYVFTYYSTQILIAAVILFLLVQAGLALYRMSRENVLYCLLVNQTQAGDRELAALEQDFRSYAGITSQKQTVTFDMAVSLDDPSYADASVIKLTSLHSTDTMDTMITTAEILERYRDQELYLDLSLLLPDELFAALEGRLYYAPDARGNSIPIGIALKDSYLAGQLTLVEDSFLAVTSTNHSPETVVAFIRYCMQQAAVQTSRSDGR